ncbi:MAG: IS200/IS605 family transposase [Methanomassiliicoccaceae archaeon]|nr:IS200/IS605 family transposase [Methanomassiliicoccaceae archaeon]
MVDFDEYSEVRKTGNAVYNLNYHIVFCPKYRRSILVGSVGDDLALILRTICASNNWNLMAMEIMEDHVHLFISAMPITSPATIVKLLKGVSARQLYLKHPELKKQLWKGHIWSSGYYIGTAGTVSARSIREYIQGQERHHGKD